MPGWTLSYGPGFELINQGWGFGGTQNIELDGYLNSGIKQVVTTTPNRSYELSIYYSPRSAVTNSSNIVEVYFNGVLLQTLSGIGSTGNYQRYAWTVTATTFTSTIEFRAGGESDTAGGLIDNVGFAAIN